MSTETLLRVDNLVKHFPIYQGVIRRQVGAVHAVDGVSFDIYKGETLGLVGESGCGKSTAGRTILRLYKPTDGHVYYDGTDLASLSDREMRRMRRKLQIIFQDPYASLNPRMTVADIVGEPLIVHKVANGKEVQERVQELLALVGLNPAFADRYPHEFSGGQRQRIGVARSLALQPDLIICDEPISALDVSIQAQIINLLMDLKANFDLSLIIISHDLAVVEYICDRIVVMYLGKVMETAVYSDLYGRAKHPYTQALLSAVPVADPLRKKARIILKGDVPSPIDPPSGCRFHTRCPKRMDICDQADPEMIDFGNGHQAACHLYTRANAH